MCPMSNLGGALVRGLPFFSRGYDDYDSAASGGRHAVADTMVMEFGVTRNHDTCMYDS